MKRILTIASILAIVLTVNVKAEKVKAERMNDRYSKMLVGNRVIEALGNIGDPRASGVLVQALKNKEPMLKAPAALALGKINDKQSIPLLKNLLDDRNYLVRISSAIALFNLDQKEMKARLLSFLSDENPTVRAAAVEQVGGLGNKEFLSALTEMLAKEKDYLVRAKLIEQLGRNKFKPALVYIRKALGDENGCVRYAACVAIDNMDDKRSMRGLLQRFKNDTSPSVRAEAKVALSKLGNRSLIDFFWKETKEEDYLLRGSSYLALANLGEVDILPVLSKEIVNAENPRIIRIQVARAFTALKPYVDKLVKRLMDKAKVSDRDSLKKNLQFDYRVNSNNLILILTQALKDRDNPLYKDAPLLLKELNAQIALPALREALLQDDPESVATIAYVLGLFNDKHAVDDLIQVFKKYEL